jgi:hypothetical protein
MPRNSLFKVFNAVHITISTLSFLQVLTHKRFIIEYSLGVMRYCCLNEEICITATSNIHCKLNLKEITMCSFQLQTSGTNYGEKWIVFCGVKKEQALIAETVGTFNFQ